MSSVLSVICPQCGPNEIDAAYGRGAGGDSSGLCWPWMGSVENPRIKFWLCDEGYAMGYSTGPTTSRAASQGINGFI